MVSGTYDAGPLGESTFSDALEVSYSTGDAVEAGNLFLSLSSTGGGRAHFDNVSVSVVPEPSGFGLLALGGLALLGRRRK